MICYINCVFASLGIDFGPWFFARIFLKLLIGGFLAGAQATYDHLED